MEGTASAQPRKRTGARADGGGDGDGDGDGDGGADDEDARRKALLGDSAPWSREDLSSAALLVLLYVIQGIPMGLVFGSVPMLLKGLAHVDYAELGLFSLASYPYSLKLLWSPLVDSIYWRSFGRRKSWIIPIQTISGLLMLSVGWHIDAWLASEDLNVAWLTTIFVVIMVLTATQDVAVDGWAISMLSEEHRGFAATCQTVGLNTGYFLAFTVFLSFNSAEFCNSYVRGPLGIPELPVGFFQLGVFVQFWAVVYLVVTLLIAVLKREAPEPSDVPQSTVADVYRHVRDVMRLPNMFQLISLLLLCKVGFACFDNVSAMKLLDRGYKKENLALTVLLDFPFQLFIGYHAARYAHGSSALAPWLWGYITRMVFVLLGVVVVAAYPNPGSEDVPLWYHVLVIASALLTSCMQTVMFVCISAYFSVISDPAIGGTYMTLLNTFSNLGGTWPQYFVMKAVDYATTAWCVLPPAADGAAPAEAQSCVHHHERETCTRAGGVCRTEIDGFYIVSIVSVVLGTATLLYLRRVVRTLEALPPSAWRVHRAKDDDLGPVLPHDLIGNGHADDYERGTKRNGARHDAEGSARKKLA